MSALASGVSSSNRVNIFEEPSSGWSDSSTPTAQLSGSSITGGFFGSTVHLATNVAGDPMIVSAASYLNTNDAAENVFYEPSSGWNSDQQPNQVIDLLSPNHWDMAGLHGAGANTVIFANCDSGSGCASPIYVYQYQ